MDSAKNTTINLDDALAYCEECANTAEKLRDKCYDSAVNGGPDSVLSAIPYFTQQIHMYRYDIPAILKGVAEQQAEKSNGGKSNE